ncbi:thiamine phosphate synthase [Ferrovum sp. PN-J185]|uniref:thiamine phosphate synthase n=1 Tax=Ferrovum sp. PN-J185 TaxID=1356306 RepID=UPI000792EE25|nr:thiamine phosphate synthase [Ferrovum sp. PN-J185]KXW55886.1 thiamine-phosphate synthase [Ferrovum sp. PN-J185]MCC6068725.1 thiamine phosphate synthase [Ferrovum sp. PN-J185]
MTHIKHATPSGLYAITPESFGFNQLIEWAECLLAHRVQWFQYRRKQLSKQQMLDEAQILNQLITHHDGHLIINDHVDLATEINAHGVHLGASDLTLTELQERFPSHRLMVGASCYNSLELAVEAQHKGADYVAFGSVFASQTKPQAVLAPLHLFSESQTLLTIPTVAIGGINLDNASVILNTGVTAIAVVQALSNLTTLESTVQQFQQLIEARKQHEHA